MALIEIENLEKIYRDDGTETPALRGVSFHMKEGEFAAVIGPSGSGKSTLLHILGFLDVPSRGEYRLEGKTFNNYSPREVARLRNKKMGFVFQAFNLLPRTTVFENVKLPLIYSDIPESQWERRTLEAVEAVGLSHRLRYETSQLSGGEKQRVAIARALVVKPQIIFADEPTGNLDSKSGEAIMEILQNLNEKHRHTIILITHETYTAEHAERILELKDGLLVEDRRVPKRRHAYDHEFIK